jgi:hypothetical protein
MGANALGVTPGQKPGLSFGAGGIGNLGGMNPGGQSLKPGLGNAIGGTLGFGNLTAKSPFPKIAAAMVPGPASVQPAPGGPTSIPQPGAARPPQQPPMGQPGMQPPGMPMQPPGQPGQGQMQPPPPPMPPMAEAPPPPLPANPRPSQPSPKNSDQAMREAMMLHMMEQKQQPNDPQQDMPSSLMSAHTKLAQRHPRQADKLSAQLRRRCCGRLLETGWRECF